MDEVDLRPERLSDSVARYLEKLVLEGTLRAGDRLPAERKLAAGSTSRGQACARRCRSWKRLGWWKLAMAAAPSSATRSAPR